MREIYGEIIESAFDRGIADAWAFWDMTPAEIHGRLRAFRAAKDAEGMRDDRLAWMVGLYTAKGINNPKKFPDKPNIIRVNAAPDAPARDMDADEMQTLLTAFAEVHNAIEGAKS